MPQLTNDNIRAVNEPIHAINRLINNMKVLFVAITHLIHAIENRKYNQAKEREIVRQALAKGGSDHDKCALDIDPLHFLRTFVWNNCSLNRSQFEQHIRAVLRKMQSD